VILSQLDLRAAVTNKEIRFDPPLEERQWGEASVDLRLGMQFTQLQAVSGLKISVAEGIRHLPGFWKTKELKIRDDFGKRETFALDPGEFVLAMTHEKITVPKNLIALVEGRSTYARVGLSMHQTAPWIQPGWSGPIVLEIKNHGPVCVELTPLLDRPCQLTFFQITRELPPDLAYGGKPGDSYKDQNHPLAPKKKRAKKS
jgi:dCTP deaminase